MKSLVLIAIGAGALALTGCRNATDVGVTDAYRVSFGGMGYGYVSIFTDPQTGCDYFMTDDGFLSPRLTPAGGQVCRSAIRAPSPSVGAPQ